MSSDSRHDALAQAAKRRSAHSVEAVRLPATIFSGINGVPFAAGRSH